MKEEMHILKKSKEKWKSRYGFSSASRYLIVKTDTDGHAHALLGTPNIGKINLRGLKFVIVGAATVFGLLASNLAHAAERQHELQISEQSVAGALNQLAEQTGVVLIFPYDLVEARQANSLAGVYGVSEALEFLLKGSGLTGSLAESGVIVITREKDAKASHREESIVVGKQIKNTLLAGASALVISGVATPAMAQTDTPIATSTTVMQAKGPSGVGDPAEVTGTVTETGSRANLKGAQVLIVETGQKTATDDLGRFRFPSVAPGEYTLAISYLGFTDNSVRIIVESGEDVEKNFALTGGSDDTNVVYVHGTRSGRAQSLNLQRTAANNSEVVSADLLGNFTGSTISEALQRVPGITFQQTSLTGEGTNIIVRGLAPDLNTVTLNGLRLPDNSGTGRSGDLSNILADSVSKITVNKSLLPSHDSSGTGGLVEIETKSPLDRPKRYFNASIEGGQSGKGFSDDLLASGTASGTFGTSDQFGLSASVQIRDRKFDSVSHGNIFTFGQYLPLEADGSLSITSLSQVDPRLLFPFEAGASNIYPRAGDFAAVTTDTTNRTLGLSAEWQVNAVTNLRFDFQHIDSDLKTFRQGGSIGSIPLYQPANVIALGGETRNALTTFPLIVPRQSLNSFNTNNKTDAISFRGVSKPDNWTFEYGAGYTKGSQDIEQASASFGTFLFYNPGTFLSSAATDAVEGRVLSIYAPVTAGIQLPLLSQTGFDLLNDPGTYKLEFADSSTAISSNERMTAEFSSRYTFGSDKLQYIEGGVYYERANFDTEFNPGKDSTDFIRGGGLFGNGVTAADFGLMLDTGNIGDRIGANLEVGVLQAGNLDELFAQMRGLDGAGVTIVTNPVDSRLAGEFTREEELSGYVETGLKFGKLDVIGGVRIANVKTKASKLQRPFLRLADGSTDTAFIDANTVIVNFDDTVTDVLPRVLANYRQSDNLVFRGGYYFTVARPTISDLSASPRISLSLRPTGGPSGNQPTLNVDQGNPGLKPAFTHNFDLGAELYNDNVGVIKFGLFYKRVENFLQSNTSSTSEALEGITLPDDPRFQNLPSDIFIQVNRPSNADGIAEIWGAEAAIEHRFSNLPGLLDGLGVYANYTFSDSSRDAALTWSSSPVFDANGVIIGREQLNYVREAPFAQQSRHSGTAAITYEREDFDASLSYSVQSRRFSKFGDSGVGDTFGFDQYIDQADSLDFRAEYRLAPAIGGQYRIWVEGQNLLDGPSDPTVSQSLGGAQGVPKVTAFRSFIGGRSFKLGVSATF